MLPKEYARISEYEHAPPWTSMSPKQENNYSDVMVDSCQRCLDKLSTIQHASNDRQAIMSLPVSAK